MSAKIKPYGSKSKLKVIRAVGMGAYVQTQDGTWWVLNPQTGWIPAGQSRALAHCIAEADQEARANR